MRADGRARDALRPVTIETGVQAYAEGSALIACGRTRVLCAATVEQRVPPWLLGQGRGWVTGEYAMLPRATTTRTARERSGPSAHPGDQRLIGAPCAPPSLDLLGERMITVDCDVLQADGGTRTASVTGGYIALALAIQGLVRNGEAPPDVLSSPVAAVSVGTVDGVALLDLAYDEDARAEVDMNVVMNGAGEFIEVQGTAEGAPFSAERLSEFLALAGGGIRQLLAAQRAALGDPPLQTHNRE